MESLSVLENLVNENLSGTQTSAEVLATESQKLTVLRFLEKNSSHGEVVSKIAGNRAYVDFRAPIEELAIDLDRRRDVNAVGVVDESMRIMGMVVRRNLFDLFGKPYGRDILKHKTVERIIEKTVVFNADRNIFSVSDEISLDLRSDAIRYYLLSNADSVYKGIFSTRDMLIYLSDMTQKDIALARSLQKSIVKEEMIIEKTEFSILGASRMAKGVGGDFYFVKEYLPRRWIFAVCDVSGKGVSASLVTTSISGMFSMYSFEDGIAEFIKKLNQSICESFEMQKFVTGIFVDYLEETGELVIYDMGHSYIYVYKDNKLFKLKTSSQNLPIGVTESMETVAADSFMIGKGDLFILITDGIAEQTNQKGEEYGDKRMANIIKTQKREGLKALKDKLFEEIYQYRGEQPQHDDMTILMLSKREN